MKKVALACLMAAMSSSALAQKYERTETGIVVSTTSGLVLSAPGLSWRHH